jgi:hypothetical protein
MHPTLLTVAEANLVPIGSAFQKKDILPLLSDVEDRIALPRTRMDLQEGFNYLYGLLLRKHGSRQYQKSHKIE